MRAITSRSGGGSLLHEARESASTGLLSEVSHRSLRTPERRVLGEAGRADSELAVELERRMQFTK